MLPYTHTQIYMHMYSDNFIVKMRCARGVPTYTNLLLSENTSGHLSLLRGWRTSMKVLLAIHYFNALTILKQSQESIASLLIPISRFD